MSVVRQLLTGACALIPSVVNIHREVRSQSKTGFYICLLQNKSTGVD